MKNRDRFLPVLAALRNQSQALHSHEITDLGTMSFQDFWNTDTALTDGCSTLICSADLSRTAQLLRHCATLRKGCLIMSKQMESKAQELCSLFPLGEVDMPAQGGIVLWEPGGPNLKLYFTQSQSCYPVVLMPGLNLGADALAELSTRYCSSGFLLISQNLRQEMSQHPGDIPAVLSADQLILHGPGDPETICAHLPQSKVNQPGFDTVINFHNPTMPQHTGAGKALLNRGSACGKVHKLSLSLAQSMTLVEKPILGPGELRKNKERTVIINRQKCIYSMVTLIQEVRTLSTWLDDAFAQWTRWEDRLRRR